MNNIWIFMVFVSISILLFINPSQALNTMLTSAQSGFTLCLNMCAIYAVWLGFMEILEQSGLAEKLAKLLSPIIKKLFKTQDPQAIKHLSINISANILGLGNAATPSGIEAVKHLDDKTNKASFGIIMLLVINASSLQVLPSTVIALREQYGSVASANIFLPSLLTTILTTTLAILLVFLCNRLSKRKSRCRNL